MAERTRPFPHYKFPDEIEIEYEKLDDDSCSWHNLSKGSCSLRTINYGWFPTDVLMGVVDGKYADTNKIGATISGNMGTAGMGVFDIVKAIELLNAAGYKQINEKL